MTDAAFDPYATLGLRPGADASEVRAAYRRLARQYHPDRSGDRRTTERMQAINRARAILSDPARRAGVDASTANARPSSTGHWSATRSAQWASPPGSWSTGTATMRPYRSPGPAVEDGPAGLAVLVTILLLVLLGPVLFVFPPLAFSGLFVLLALGTLARAGGR
ncbi:MAG TPA: J domain-containing protein [Candidatus Limnocylindrales bacterium]|nr:J domain-containing protein [Candidatus Limnocylindrales bacterium]